MVDSIHSLPDFHERRILLLHVERQVFVSGSGPGVVIVGTGSRSELVRAARWIRTAQFTSYLLLESAESSWLRALARTAHAECGDPGVGLFADGFSRQAFARVAFEPCVLAAALLPRLEFIVSRPSDGRALLREGSDASPSALQQDVLRVFRSHLYPEREFTPETII
jgi:hypothetical protein